MNIVAAIEEILSSSNWNKARLAKHLGKSPQSMNDRLQPMKSLRVDSVVEMIEPLGYEMMLVPIGSQKPRGAYVISDESLDPVNRSVGRPKKATPEE